MFGSMFCTELSGAECYLLTALRTEPLSLGLLCPLPGQSLLLLSFLPRLCTLRSLGRPVGLTDKIVSHLLYFLHLTYLSSLTILISHISHIVHRTSHISHNSHLSSLTSLISHLSQFSHLTSASLTFCMKIISWHFSQIL